MEIFHASTSPPVRSVLTPPEQSPVHCVAKIRIIWALGTEQRPHCLLLIPPHRTPGGSAASDSWLGSSALPKCRPGSLDKPRTCPPRGAGRPSSRQPVGLGEHPSQHSSSNEPLSHLLSVSNFTTSLKQMERRSIEKAALGPYSAEMMEKFPELQWAAALSFFCICMVNFLSQDGALNTD